MKPGGRANDFGLVAKPFSHCGQENFPACHIGSPHAADVSFISPCCEKGSERFLLEGQCVTIGELFTMDKRAHRGFRKNQCSQFGALETRLSKPCRRR